MDTPAALEATNLRFHYHRQPALDGISLRLNAGETLGLLGPNGAGKSTLLHVLSGLLRPAAGNVELDGKDLHRHPELRRRIGYLPARPPLYDDLTPREQLGFAARLHHLTDAESLIENTIERCEIGAVARRRNGQLSKGYRQRVGLALALLHQPKILLLDEPGDGLDPLQMRHFHQLLRSFAAETAIILSSHNLAEVKALCDQLLIIDRGRALLATTMAALDEPLDLLFTRLIYGGDDV